ncbi:MAG: hypothetical protein GY929_25935 [Actinomycetia bacterium]|nr:hypothetical protein [Actinomycetes bacterium]
MSVRATLAADYSPIKVEPVTGTIGSRHFAVLDCQRFHRRVERVTLIGDRQA